MIAPDDIGIGDICAVVAVCRCNHMTRMAGLDCEVIEVLGMKPKWTGCCARVPSNEEVYRVNVRGIHLYFFLSRSELRKRPAVAQVLLVPAIEPKPAMAAAS